MAGVPAWRTLTGQTTMVQLIAELAAFFGKLAYTLTHVSFPDIDASGSRTSGNLDVDIQTVTFATTDTDTFIAHGLGYQATRWLVVSIDQPCSVYDGASTSNSNGLYLRAKFAAPVTEVNAAVLIFGSRRKP